MGGRVLAQTERRLTSAVVIPARYASTRLPGKPLLRDTGRFLIQHVYDQARRATRPTQVIVATDDARVVEALRGLGGIAVLTRADHPSGTDRVAEVAATLDVDIVVNVQGDEPELAPDAVDRVVEVLEQYPDADMATLAAPMTSMAQWQDPANVKVVMDQTGRALYFSRSPIPFVRDGQPVFGTPASRFYLHVGMYAYRRAFLLEAAGWPPSDLERTEKLEQLRVLERGRTIRVGVVDHAAPGIDTPADYAAFVDRWQQRADPDRDMRC